MKEVFTIGTRGSKLALWQAGYVRDRLAEAHPQALIKLEIIKTSGDKIQDVSLTEIGGRGVFTKELETALLNQQIDLAVHSLKDLPTILPADLHLSAVLEREDVRDALIVRTANGSDRVTDTPTAPLPLSILTKQAVVGTSSLRRASQLKNLRSDLQIKDIRGNVDTRLQKLDNGEYDAIVLAVAGLKRLGLDNRISAILSFDEMLPQVGQGALGIETRKDDARTNALVAVLNHTETLACVTAERAFLRGLGGGCQFPIASLGTIENAVLHLSGLVAAQDGSLILRDVETGETENAAEVGERLAQKLLEKGAGDLIGQNHLR